MTILNRCTVRGEKDEEPLASAPSQPAPWMLLLLALLYGLLCLERAPGESVGLVGAAR
ncbi:hypothetical protein CGRA01v4_03012 [Colletotrichum graminicola]|nr:hypothetical protein CGRA01v4_03012 [Colletotrichum graminicola]